MKHVPLTVRPSTESYEPKMVPQGSRLAVQAKHMHFEFMKLAFLFLDRGKTCYLEPELREDGGDEDYQLDLSKGLANAVPRQAGEGQRLPELDV